MDVVLVHHRSDRTGSPGRLLPLAQERGFAHATHPARMEQKLCRIPFSVVLQALQEFSVSFTDRRRDLSQQVRPVWMTEIRFREADDDLVAGVPDAVGHT
ncbi:hypothetical protein [Streptomyces phaeochromogenes]|uniref:hypothetical protein n=1 Tax=Streptomyces phaeochromogenes TaxID=1923 RepID=UPI002DDAFC45|nr:hypothetical protein [Streptomyces phaeochromogenes]WRZ35902.1 hypothetical protein OG931_53425 [Streptomyces phaeochromogenes]